MKKFILLLIMFVFSLGSFAQTEYYKTYAFRCKVENGGWTEWTRSDIPVTFELSQNRLIIFTEQDQIIDYGNLREKTTSSYKMLYGPATDSQYNNIYIYITRYKSGVFVITVEYSDIQYSYKIKKVPW